MGYDLSPRIALLVQSAPGAWRAPRQPVDKREGWAPRHPSRFHIKGRLSRPWWLPACVGDGYGVLPQGEDCGADVALQEADNLIRGKRGELTVYRRFLGSMFERVNFSSQTATIIVHRWLPLQGRRSGMLVRTRPGETDMQPTVPLGAMLSPKGCRRGCSLGRKVRHESSPRK
jgi:hypothetical protein